MNNLPDSSISKVNKIYCPKHSAYSTYKVITTVHDYELDLPVVLEDKVTDCCSREEASWAFKILIFLASLGLIFLAGYKFI